MGRLGRMLMQLAARSTQRARKARDARANALLDPERVLAAASVLDSSAAVACRKLEEAQENDGSGAAGPVDGDEEAATEGNSAIRGAREVVHGAGVLL